MRKMKTLAGVVLAAMLGLAGSLRAEIVVDDWAEAINREVYHGQTHIATKAGVADVLAEKQVVVITTVAEADEKIGQLTRQTEATGREGVLVVVLGDGDTLTAVAEIDRKTKRAGHTMEVAQTMIESAPTGYAGANAAGKKVKSPKAPTAPTAKTAGTQTAKSAATETTPTTKISATEDSTQSYWLNTKTGKRHNKNCRYYGKGKNGRPCKHDEGTPCGVCGG